MKNSGKMTFTGLLIIFLIIYGAFAAIKLISSSITEKEISKKIKDTFGVDRGYGFTEASGEEIIKKILSNSSGIIFDKDDRDSVEVTIDNEKKKIFYYYEYEVVTNLIFFKKRKRVLKDEEIRSYH